MSFKDISMHVNDRLNTKPGDDEGDNSKMFWANMRRFEIVIKRTEMYERTMNASVIDISLKSIYSTTHVLPLLPIYNPPNCRRQKIVYINK